MDNASPLGCSVRLDKILSLGGNYLKGKNQDDRSHMQRSRVEVGRKISLCKKKDQNLFNYQGPDHSIY